MAGPNFELWKIGAVTPESQQRTRVSHRDSIENYIQDRMPGFLQELRERSDVNPLPLVRAVYNRDTITLTRTPATAGSYTGTSRPTSLNGNPVILEMGCVLQYTLLASANPGKFKVTMKFVVDGTIAATVPVEFEYQRDTHYEQPVAAKVVLSNTSILGAGQRDIRIDYSFSSVNTTSGSVAVSGEYFMLTDASYDERVSIVGTGAGTSTGEGGSTVPAAASGAHAMDDGTHSNVVTGMVEQKGDLLVWDDSVSKWTRVGVGPDGYSFIADSAVPNVGVKWASPSVASHPVISSGDLHPEYLTPAEHTTTSHAGVPGIVVDHSALTGLTTGDPHSQYPALGQSETIAGMWMFDNTVKFKAQGSIATPPTGQVALAAIVSGANIILRLVGPSGATCDICTVANGVVVGTNELQLNWIN